MRSDETALVASITGLAWTVAVGEAVVTTLGAGITAVVLLVTALGAIVNAFVATVAVVVAVIATRRAAVSRGHKSRPDPFLPA